MIYSSGDHFENEGKLSLRGVIGALVGSPGSGAVCLSVVLFNQRSPLLVSPAEARMPWVVRRGPRCPLEPLCQPLNWLSYWNSGELFQSETLVTLASVTPLSEHGIFFLPISLVCMIMQGTQLYSRFFKKDNLKHLEIQFYLFPNLLPLENVCACVCLCVYILINSTLL